MARLLLGLMFLPLAASAADDLRFSYLEQEMRNLQRQVQVLTRELDDLRTRTDRQQQKPSAPGVAPAAAGTASLPGWVDAALWRRLRPGMSELEVIGSLGRPTSMREESGARVLFYAMEIGSGFLGGSVKLRERVVVEVRQPTLQ